MFGRILLALWVLLAALLLAPAPALAADGGAHGVLSDTASWALLAGVLTPLLTSLVQQPKWSRRTRVIVSVIVSAAIGLLTLLANGSLNDGPQTALSAVTLVIVAASASYKTIWEPMGVAPAIESATSPSPSLHRRDE